MGESLPTTQAPAAPSLTDPDGFRGYWASRSLYTGFSQVWQTPPLLRSTFPAGPPQDAHPYPEWLGSVDFSQIADVPTLLAPSARAEVTRNMVHNWANAVRDAKSGNFTTLAGTLAAHGIMATRWGSKLVLSAGPAYAQSRNGRRRLGNPRQGGGRRVSCAPPRVADQWQSGHCGRSGRGASEC